MLNSTNEVPVDQRSCSCAIAGNNWLAKRSLAMKASTHLNACSGTSTAPDSLMIGACGQSRLILYSNFLPVHLGHSGLSGGLDKLRDGSRIDASASSTRCSNSLRSDSRTAARQNFSQSCLIQGADRA